MWEEQSMGSQTLEILRQGVWASATGGWFYDPSQDVFCNTFHLYTWLFLLCLPFSIYLYFPPAEYVWYFYCAAVTIAFSVIKALNYYMHCIYDTKECIQEEVSENSSNNEQKREDEGIEMQDLSNRETVDGSERWLSILASLEAAGARPGVDLDSIDSDFHHIGATLETNNRKQSSTIDLKAEVHRNNSSESSEAGAQIVEVITHEPPDQDNEKSSTEKRYKHQRSKTDRFVTVSVKDEKNPIKNYKKISTPGCIELQDPKKDMLIHHRPSLQSVDSEQSTSTVIGNSDHKRLNFTNSSLNFLPVSVQSDIKPTGSLELGYIDKNPNQVLTSEGFYFKHNIRTGVRRIRSTALETCCPPPSLTAHPNSLEVIGCKGARNPLPPPSTTLIRNQHLNLCPYYGSEIVYPIAEQSDEHQTSHGPDTDLESMTHMSDSDFEENNQGSNSPLLYIKLKKLQNVPYSEKHSKCPRILDEERTSATSKDALLDQENSNSTNTPEVSGAQGDCDATDNDISDKSANLSCSSVEFDNRTDHKVNYNLGKVRTKWTSDNNKSDIQMQCSDKCQDDREVAGAVKKRNNRKIRRKRVDKGKDNSSSLVELDLDWLFDDEGHKLQHRKEPLKKESDWSSTTTVSLEHDVSKVLQEPLPAMRSLGAIPKRPVNANKSDRETNTPKSESKKCRSCRCKPPNKEFRNRPKENKITQTLRPSDSLEGLECIVLPPTKPSKISLQKKDSIKSVNGKNEEASSSGSNNELSTLLPPAAPLLSAFLNSRRELPPSSCNPSDCFRLDNSPHPHHHRSKLRRERVSRRRSNHLAKKENAIACSLSAGYGTHSAKNFNDTSDGAVHCFMDEHGNWVTYTFDEKGVGTSNSGLAEAAASEQPAVKRKQSDGSTARNKSAADLVELWDSPESMCSSTVSTIQESKPTNYYCESYPYTRPVRLRQNFTPRAVATQNIKLMIEDVLNSNEPPVDPDFIKTDHEDSVVKNRFKLIRVNNSETRQTKSYYKIKVFPWAHVKVTLDRLKLLTLLDRNLTICETVLSILLAVLVGVLGATLLYFDFYKDLLAFVFCFILASCQYSLLKSVQPDAASPTHGFNRVIAYSRPIYFCIFCTLILILHANIDPKFIESDFYANSNPKQYMLVSAREFFITFILFLPVLFSLGLFPQINTFVLYLLEQIDIHVFGGNAMSSLTASFYCIFRSVLAIVILVGLAYGALIEDKSSQHILFSIFCACLVGTCYHLSRSASDPTYIWNLVKKHLWLPDIYKDSEVETEERPEDKSQVKEKTVKFPPDVKDNSREEHVDPLPHKLQKTVNARLKNDVILCCLSAILAFAIHASTVFTVLRPDLSPVLWSMAASLGIILHYVIPQLRKQLPWLCIARPILRSHEHEHFQIRGPAKIMWFERVYIYFCFIERNVLFPLVFLSVLTEDAPKIAEKYGAILGSFITVVCGLKCLRSTYSDQSYQYLIVIFTTLFFKYDYCYLNETFLVEYFLMSIAFQKVHELILKLQFVITYIAPWQITWGSAFHAFAQPFSVPHSAMLFMQALVSSFLSTPLNPFLGSAIFFTSYVRPVKFWERDYNTRRVDHSNTPLSSHLDRNLGADDNNLNSIFYEHLTRSLQHSLCGDLAMGRWGPVNQGDVFVMASDYLNCLVHIIELGNGLVTFQMRGLEFRGTYCQQREVEAITEGVEENDGCCCCDTGHLPNMLSINAAFSQRWLAWEVTAAKYILEGYSISDNSVVSMLQVFEFRKVLVSYYVKSIIFYTIRSPKLDEWLTSQVILKALQPMEHRNFVDLDPVFNYNIDEDYDLQHSGMTKAIFVEVHGDWINFCVEKNEKPIDPIQKSTLILLCFGLSLLGRRTLGAVSHNTVSSVEFFLYGLHALFKGDFRITCARDEWVFTDMDLLKTVVAPGVRMSLKLHQDHFMSPDEYEELPTLYEAICKHEAELVISHEGDPVWRNAVLSGTPSLLALRHVFDEGNDEYKIIMLNKRYLSFRIIKINKECVRGLWAGQQQELVYLRNRNPERGSIQNAKQALRNIINSSCDQPIGYPIYVSPLTTSYAETNEQYCSIIGGSISLKKIRNYVFNTFRRIRKRCGEGCSSGGSNREEIGMGHEGVYAMTPMTFPTTGSQSIDGSHLGGSMGRGSSLSRTSLGGNRGSLVSVGKPTSSTLASLAGLFKERDERAVSQAPDAQDARQDERLGDANDTEKEFVASRVRITDPTLVHDSINLGRRIDVLWPTDYMRCRGGKSYWKEWIPEAGMEGLVVHKWNPCHKDPTKRSHIDKTILLVQIEDKFVPITESGTQDLGPEV